MCYTPIYAFDFLDITYEVQNKEAFEKYPAEKKLSLFQAYCRMCGSVQQGFSIITG
jgi:hypothetical protein